MPRRNYTLRLYSPIPQGEVFIADITDIVVSWSRSVQLQGGFGQGAISIIGPTEFVEAAFSNWMGAKVEERQGDLTWEGMIFEMELAINGVRRRRSFEQMYNAVDVSYTSGGVPSTTGWIIDQQSINLYGRRENKLSLSGDVPTATATAYANRYLNQYSRPFPRPVSYSREQGTSSLDIRVTGFVYTANWKYTTVTLGAPSTASAVITSIINTDLEFLLKGMINTNTLTINTLDANQRAWDSIQSIVKLGDSVGDAPWRVWVNPDRFMSYEKVADSPRYFLRGGRVLDNVAAQYETAPRFARPGIARDADYPFATQFPTGFPSRSSDILVDEVSVGNDGKLSLTTREFDNIELLTNQAQRSAELLQGDEDV